MTFANTCDGLRCSEQASNTIQFIIDEASTIILNLCDECATRFQGSNGPKKKTLEQQVVGPERSNINHTQPTNNPRGSLNG